MKQTITVKLNKAIALLAVSSLCTLGALHAQDSYSGLYPEITTSLTVSSGFTNLNENPDLETVPGLSSDYTADFELLLKGNFKRLGEWGVEKNDGIQNKSGVGYEAALTVDLAKFFEIAEGSSASSMSGSYSNNYTLIQDMINWYEANMSRLGLPYDPCGTVMGTPLGTMWPTDTYGGGSGKYVFISGSTCEKASDVNWTTSVWMDAYQLYQEIYTDISTVLENLYTDTVLFTTENYHFPTSDITEIEYSSMTSKAKKMAEIREKAKNDFYKVANGKTDSISVADAISTAYVKFTNIANVMDVRMDFLGKRLSAGTNIQSYLAGQSTTGAALKTSLKQGLIPGLEAGLSVGIAGGTEQDTEDYNTIELDYFRGYSGELAVMADARYTKFIPSLQGTLIVSGQAIDSDLLLANKNVAFDLGARYKSNTFVSFGVGAEGLFLNYKDREDDNASYKTAYSGTADMYVGAYGLTLSGSASYKTEQFAHKIFYVTEDSFAGYSLNSDYYTANLESALKAKGSLEFNPEYFTGFDIVTVNGGAEIFMYGDTLKKYGLGGFADLSFDIQDLTNVPVVLNVGAHYYKNDKVKVYDDMASLKEQKFIDYTKLKAGVTFKPVDYVTIGFDFMSDPSYSRRNNQRVSSFTLNGTILFD